MATTYFSISGSDVIAEFVPDTDMALSDVESTAQRIEHDVMHRLGLSAAPSDAIDLGALKRAIMLLTAASVESREPHSAQDGSFSVQKFNRHLWQRDAEQIIRRFEYYILKT